MSLLEDYAKSFERDMPLSVKILIREQKRRFESYYDCLPRDQALKRLGTMLLHRDWREFVHYFKIAVDNMDTQYLEIRASRKESFKHDLGALDQRGCDIDLEMNRCDEMVDWSIKEPFTRQAPLERPGWRRSYHSDEDPYIPKELYDSEWYRLSRD